MSECIFCKIIKKEIPSHTIYEDDNVLAFLDINPHAKGHTVVIPKVHAETAFELSEDQIKDLFLGVKKTQEKIEQVLSPDGYNIGWNHNKAGGQVVPHIHVHIMPRYSDDGGTSMHGIVNNPGNESVDNLAKLF
jgi:histidine triad (HIT) family protein